jgi:hypothetical protein
MDKNQLCAALEGFGVENLFWRISYLTNMAFHTPLCRDLRSKLLRFYKVYDSILTQVYPGGEAQALAAEMARNNRLFAAYVEEFMGQSHQISAASAAWRESCQQLPALICQLCPSCHLLEWSAMLSQERELLESLAQDLWLREYAILVDTIPMCRRLAVEMAQYLSQGIMEASHSA